MIILLFDKFSSRMPHEFVRYREIKNIWNFDVTRWAGGIFTLINFLLEPRSFQIFLDSKKNCFTTTVWCAIFKTEITGFFYEDGTVTEERSKRMLRYFLFPKFANYPFDMIHQQDEASQHYDNKIRKYLDHQLPNRWMGRGINFRGLLDLLTWPHATSFFGII